MEQDDQKWLTLACEQAQLAVESGEGGPFGAVIVRRGELIAAAHNRVTSDIDPTAHAEMSAIRQAARKLGDFNLSDCVIYSSCQPCPMCLSAIYWARIPRLVFANTQQQAQAIGFDDQWIAEQIQKPLSKQSLIIEHCPCQQEHNAFESWQQKIDKIEY